MADAEPSNLPLIGWRERLALPDLAITSVKAKIDTGARSSALHAFDLEFFQRDGVDYVRFKAHASQRSHKKIITAEAPLLDRRAVRNSGGHAEVRPVILTTVAAGDTTWPIELTLTDRNLMGFRMLLGRQAVRQRFLVDSGRSYLQTSRPTQKIKGQKKSKKSKKAKTKTTKKIKHENSRIVEKLIALFNPPSGGGR